MQDTYKESALEEAEVEMRSLEYQEQKDDIKNSISGNGDSESE